MEESKWEYGMGLTIYPSQVQEIEKVLSDLKERCPAKFLLLVDVSGHLISSLSSREEKHLVELASLIAGDLAASQEIARLTGQFNSSQLVMREGEKAVSFLAEAGDQMILFVQLTRDVPLGWARLVINEAGKKIAEIIKTRPEDGSEIKTDMDNGHFSEAIGNAFDSVWNG